MGRYQSDKGHENIIASWHNYTTFYYSIFKDFGASLYGWREFFPNSEIFGADIDTDILFNADRIKTFYCDQTKPEIIKAMWEEPVLEDNFDIIIDDGLHTFDANVCFLENSIHKLNPGGYFIIEDIVIDEYHLFVNKFEEWMDKYDDCAINILNIPSLQNANDNRLVVVYKSPE
jgi:SAM-dependent methyltransferase